MDVYHFKNFEMLDPAAGELYGGEMNMQHL
jgi:hypothetical protein